MTTIRDLFTAFAPEYREGYPHLPTSHRKVIRAICHGRSGHYGPSLSQCHSCGEPHRVYHACGHRHCPPCPQHTTQQWFHHHLDKPLPGPPCLLTCTVPETLHPFLRSHHRLASPALCTASSFALTRLAKDARFIGTDLPGFPGVLRTWGRQLPYHPHIHSLVPGGGLSKDRTAWLPSRATCFGPVQALSPLSRAMYQEKMSQAGLLEHIDPQIWHLPWNVHAQAGAHGHTACKSLAPSVFRGASSNRRRVALTDRTVPFTSRKPGSARPRTTSLDAMACRRRFLQHVLPDGFMNVRPFGFRHASCATSPHTLRRMIVPACLIPCKPTQIVAPKPLGARCPTCGVPMRLILRRWRSDKTCVDTSCKRRL